MNNVADDATNVLRRTPELLRALLIGLPDSWTDTTDVTDGWRPRDVVGHLITGELTDWIERTRRILEHGTACPSTRSTVSLTPMRPWTTSSSVSPRSAWRTSLAWTPLMTEGDLDRRGLHPSLGQVTLRELLTTWAVHDLDHVSQIFAGMAGSQDRRCRNRGVER